MTPLDEFMILQAIRLNTPMAASLQQRYADLARLFHAPRFINGPKVVPFPGARANANWFEIRNATEESADIFIYDVIGDGGFFGGGVSARDVVEQLKNLKTRKINLRVNSPGGSVFDGMAIYNALVQHPADVTTHIDGLAASIASVIALAGKTVRIAENAMMMIHDPLAFVFGDAAELRKQADVLEQIKGSILNTYVTRTGGDREALAKLMSDETWFNADEAIAQKFADEKVTGIKAAASFDLSVFGYAKAPAPKPAAPATTSSSTTPRSRLERQQALLEKTT